MKSSRFVYLFTLCSLLISLPSLSAAQGQASGGLKGGVNLAGQFGADTGGSFYIDEELGEIRIGKMERKTSFIVGAFITYKMNKFVGLQPEIFLSSKGTNEQVEISDLNVEFRWRLDYIEVPLLIKLFAPTNGPVVPAIYAGPAVALTVSTKRGAAIHSTWETEIDIDEIVKDNDFGLVFGGSIDFDIGPALIVLDGRYTMGLTSWYDAQKGEESLEIKNGVFSFMAGIASRFGQ